MPPSTNIHALPNELILLAESHWLFPSSALEHTPSVMAGLTPMKERENRAKGVHFVTQVGIMLKLPQTTLTTASVFLHRFFMRQSMIDDRATGRPSFHYYSVAATSLFLATKVEENCRKMRDIVVACVRVAQKQPEKVVDEQDKEYWRWKDTILAMEDTLLETLCFDLSVEPPYGTLFGFLGYFGVQEDKKLRNAAWGFLNDSYQTPLCVLWGSRTIAASALYCAARYCGVTFRDDEKGRPWWETVGVDLLDMKKACNVMADFYENVPLRNGAAENVYQRTPEDGGEWVAKTRELHPGHKNGHERSGSNASSEESTYSSRKRAREENGETGLAGKQDPHSSEGSEAKRIKMEANGGNGTSDVTTDANGVSSNGHGYGELRGGDGDPGNASEEGELES
jgi:protein BUR2